MRNLYRKSTENNMGTIQPTNQPTRLKTARDLGKDHSAGNGTSQKERKKERKKRIPQMGLRYRALFLMSSYCSPLLSGVVYGIFIFF
jgi:hypothetical protein